MDESEVIKSCQRGESKGQRQLFDAFADKLFRVSYRYLKDEPGAEDVVMISFNKVFKSINRFHYRGPGSLEAWLKRIVINEALMELRKKHNFNMAEISDEHHSTVDLDAVSGLPAEDIYKMIARLPTGYRTVFNLYGVEGYSHEEIAVMLNITESTSRSQLFKAKMLLKQMLTREGFSYGT